MLDASSAKDAQIEKNAVHKLSGIFCKMFGTDVSWIKVA